MKNIKLIKQSMGTLNKISKMMEEDVYCIEIIQQIDSVVGMLKKTKSELLSGHLDHCLARQMTLNPKKAIEELKTIYKITK